MLPIKRTLSFIASLLSVLCMFIYAYASDSAQDSNQPLCKRRRITPLLECSSAFSQEQEEESSERNRFVFYGRIIPVEIMLEIFRKLPIIDIFRTGQVCQGWHNLSEEPLLWKEMRLAIHGDYLEVEATKENAKLHWLRVVVNTLPDIDRMFSLVSKYQLSLKHPFADYQTTLIKLLNKRRIIDATAAQTDERGIEEEIGGLVGDIYRGDYEKSSEAILVLTRSMNEINHEATNIKEEIEQLTQDEKSYEKKIEATRVLTERLVELRNQATSIEIRIYGVACGSQGYEKELQAIADFNEHLINQGNEIAMIMRVYGLADGFYGYERAPQAAVALNEHMIGQGSVTAIQRKIEGLCEGGNGYDKSLAQLKSWIEEEEFKDMRWAYYIKAQGMKYGFFGFDKDRDSAIQYIKEYGIPY